MLFLARAAELMCMGMASAAKRNVVVKKCQICAIINITSIVGSGEPTSDRGVPINQPLQWLLSATNSIDRSLSSSHACVSHLPTSYFLLICFFHWATFLVRSVTLSERSTQVTILQRQLSIKCRQLSLAIIEQSF
jgi:hypothetical protein